VNLNEYTTKKHRNYFYKLTWDGSTCPKNVWKAEMGTAKSTETKERKE